MKALAKQLTYRILDSTISEDVYNYFNRSGANAKVVSKLLGHTNVSTTLNIYTDVYEERQIEVTEMLGNVLKSGQRGQKVVNEEKQDG